jgi:hypothetical protein
MKLLISSIVIILAVNAMTASAFLITTVQDSDTLYKGTFQVPQFSSIVNWEDSGGIASQYWQGNLDLTYRHDYFPDIDRYYRRLIVDLAASHLGSGSGAGGIMGWQGYFFGLGYDDGRYIGGGTTAGFEGSATNSTGGFDHFSYLFTYSADSASGTANLYGTINLSRNYVPGVPDMPNTASLLVVSMFIFIATRTVSKFRNRPLIRQ